MLDLFVWFRRKKALRRVYAEKLELLDKLRAREEQLADHRRAAARICDVVGVRYDQHRTVSYNIDMAICEIALERNMVSVLQQFPPEILVAAAQRRQSSRGGRSATLGVG